MRNIFSLDLKKVSCPGRNSEFGLRSVPCAVIMSKFLQGGQIGHPPFTEGIDLLHDVPGHKLLEAPDHSIRFKPADPFSLDEVLVDKASPYAAAAQNQWKSMNHGERLPTWFKGNKDVASGFLSYPLEVMGNRSLLLFAARLFVRIASIPSIADELALECIVLFRRKAEMAYIGGVAWT